MKGTIITIACDKNTGKTDKICTDAEIIDERYEDRQVENGVVCVYPGFSRQVFEGYGCAMTESACWLLSRMPEAEQERALRCWFGPSGMNADFIRIPMDSCDYSLDEYQAVDDPIADPELRTFTIARDRKYIIPMVKKAMAISEKPLSALLSPWSPPACWKTPPEIKQNDGSTYGTARTGVDFSKPSRCFGGRLKKEYYASWAKYLVKYLQAYLAEGIPVTMMSVQNESVAATSWDSCLWTGEEQLVFTRDFLYPEMKAASLTEQVGLYIWDHNKERMLENVEQMLDGGIGDLLQGFAFHWYSGDHFEALSLLREKYPEKILMHSESCALHIPGKAIAMDIPMTEEVLQKLPDGLREAVSRTPNEVDLSDAVCYAHDIIGNLNHGMNRWIDWNLMVDRRGGPRHVSGGFAAPLIFEDDGALTRTVSYEWLNLIAKTVCPGCTVLGSSRCDPEVDAAAVRCLDGTVGVLMLNRTGKDRTIHVRLSGMRVPVRLPADALTSLILKG